MDFIYLFFLEFMFIFNLNIIIDVFDYKFVKRMCV